MDVIEERLGHSPTVPELIKLLENKDEVVTRAEAARTLGELAPPRRYPSHQRWFQSN